ncbi:hypothetical protein [Vibrio xiamenensis]|uniref:hypothetical protein n=1 Tax=Vibrio xiamenensis TaxID=861298 RepID=UPI0015A245C2|nr:hypothetical protein [Vibrio xiamenensis]
MGSSLLIEQQRSKFFRQHNWCKITMAFETHHHSLGEFGKTLDKHRQPGWGARFIFG